MSGGAWERTSGYILNDNWNLKNYGSYLGCTNSNAISTKYFTIYNQKVEMDNNGLESTSLNVNEASVANYESNLKRFGDAIIEISQNGIGLTGWNKQSSRFPG